MGMTRMTQQSEPAGRQELGGTKRQTLEGEYADTQISSPRAAEWVRPIALRSRVGASFPGSGQCSELLLSASRIQSMELLSFPVLAAAGCLAAFFALLDGWYLLRVPLTLLYARWCLPTVWDLLEEQTFHTLVLPSDLDFLLHMNNARYPREADVARGVHLTRCGLFRAIRALGGHTVLSATSCRFRRSLRPLERFCIRTRLLGWDERAFFLEQRFVSARDGFVCAVLHVRQHLVGASPAKAVEHLCRRKVESPELPEEVLHWVKYNEVSSQKLRAENNLQEKGKDQ